LQGACSGGSCGLMVMTGIRLAPQATLTPWHAVLIIVGTLVLALTKNKAGLDHCRCGGAWFGASVAFRMRMMSASSAQPPACRQARIEELTGTAISMTYVSWPHRFVQPVAKLHKQAQFCRSLIRSRQRLAQPSHPSTHSSSLTVTPTTLSGTSHPSCTSDSRGFGGFVRAPTGDRLLAGTDANQQSRVGKYGSRTHTAEIRFPQRRAA